MQSIYLTPADKEITIYISFHIIHLVFGLVQYLVERLFTIQVYIKLHMIVEPGLSATNYLADISRSDKLDFKRVVFFIKNKIKICI